MYSFLRIFNCDTFLLTFIDSSMSKPRGASCLDTLDIAEGYWLVTYPIAKSKITVRLIKLKTFYILPAS